MDLLLTAKILIFILVLLTIYNFLKTNGKSRKFIVITNGVLYSVILLLLLLSFTDEQITEKQKDQYDIYQSGFLGKLTYEQSDHNYHFIRQSGLFFDEDWIAVPKDTITIPFVSKRYPYIKVFCTKDTPLFNRANNYITIDSQTYILGDNIVKITPDYETLRQDIVFIAIIIMFTVNIIQFCFILLKPRPASET